MNRARRLRTSAEDDGLIAGSSFPADDWQRAAAELTAADQTIGSSQERL